MASIKNCKEIHKAIFYTNTGVGSIVREIICTSTIDVMGISSDEDSDSEYDMNEDEDLWDDNYGRR